MNAKVFSGLLLAIVAIAAWQVTQIPESTIYSEVGPVMAPALVVGALAVLIFFYIRNTLKGKSPDAATTPEDAPVAQSGLRISYFLLGGFLFVVLVKPFGFLIPATLCGLGVAKSFGSTFTLKTTVICMVIALVFWGLFSGLLGVNLGPLLQLPL